MTVIKIYMLDELYIDVNASQPTRKHDTSPMNGALIASHFTLVLKQEAVA